MNLKNWEALSSMMNSRSKADELLVLGIVFSDLKIFSYEQLAVLRVRFVGYEDVWYKLLDECRTRLEWNME